MNVAHGDAADFSAVQDHGHFRLLPEDLAESESVDVARTRANFDLTRDEVQDSVADDARARVEPFLDRPVVVQARLGHLDDEADISGLGWRSRSSRW